MLDDVRPDYREIIPWDGEQKICVYRECSWGGRPQPTSNFNIGKSWKDGLQAYCKECKAKWKREQLYGLKPKEFDEKRQEQGDLCAICLKPFTETPCVDHDELTG